MTTLYARSVPVISAAALLALAAARNVYAQASLLTDGATSETLAIAPGGSTETVAASTGVLWLWIIPVLLLLVLAGWYLHYRYEREHKKLRY